VVAVSAIGEVSQCTDRCFVSQVVCSFSVLSSRRSRVTTTRQRRRTRPPPGAEGASISITPSGLSPSVVTIAAGQSVTFVNQDTVAHNIASTPVPTYDDCPPINRVGQLAPGQSVQTGALSVTRSCSFIDLSRVSDPRWQGTITVQ
jgi:plastocyanin